LILILIFNFDSFDFDWHRFSFDPRRVMGAEHDSGGMARRNQQQPQSQKQRTGVSAPH
jgi:hypothetical protein